MELFITKKKLLWNYFQTQLNTGKAQIDDRLKAGKGEKALNTEPPKF
jgi:hypothetical protein